MIHPDGTMDVRVGERVERRPYSVSMLGHRLGPSGMAVPHFPQYEPDIRDGELAVHTIGSDTPTIIRTRE